MNSIHISLTPSVDPRHGFTLIELLTCIAIIGILAAFLFPAISKGMGNSNSTKCASNLRQIGAAVIMYAGEHNGELPGPVNSAQPATSNNGGSNLMDYLIPYLGPYIPSPAIYAAPGTWYAPMFECPSARQVILSQQKSLSGALSYKAPWYLSPDGTKYMIPFGYPTLSAPMRLVSIERMQKNIALTDLDQKTPYSVGSTYVAAVPAHGSHRNTLYFDGHVEPVPVNP